MQVQKIKMVLIVLMYIQTSVAMNTIGAGKEKPAGIIYLGKTDPLYIEIKGRVLNDWKGAAKRAGGDTEENRLRKKQMEAWPKAKQDKFQEMAINSLRDYNKLTYFNLEGFMMFFREVNDLDLGKFQAETELRVRSAGNGKYVAEFWEDGLVVNSEANAIRYAHELAESPRAKMHPEEDLGNVEEIKKNYAAFRKAITSGKQKRYTELMALLYIQRKDRSIVFQDPGQVMYDFN
jgi:hypothetical protein